MSAYSDPAQGYSEPDRHWTLQNTAEALPDILTPLDVDVFISGNIRGWIYAVHSMGLLSDEEAAFYESRIGVDYNQCVTSVIQGRFAINALISAGINSRIPGVDPDMMELALFGGTSGVVRNSEIANVDRPQFATMFPAALSDIEDRVAQVHRDNKEWWTSEVAGNSPEASVERLDRAVGRYEEGMKQHAVVRMSYPMIEGQLLALAGEAGALDLAKRALGAHGDVLETVMAQTLFDLAQGQGTLDGFIADYGFLGKDIGNLLSTSWREDRREVIKLVESYRSHDTMAAPRVREAATRDASRAATEELLAAVPEDRRDEVRGLLKKINDMTRSLQLGKAAFTMGLDGTRAAARRIGDEMVAAGRLADRDDVFFLTRDEIARLVDGTLDDAAGVIAYRRRQRDIYRSISVPLSFVGMPEPLDPDAATDDTDRRTVTGVASGGGRVEGRARVVLDQAADIDFDEGDILVCRFTDPSWTPLFMLVAALVTDIGYDASHGAVVAREVGLPYVVGTGDGTSVIREGDRIVVDGGSHTVTVVERAERPAPVA